MASRCTDEETSREVVTSPSEQFQLGLSNEEFAEILEINFGPTSFLYKCVK